MKEKLRSLPVIAPLALWLYRLLKLPGRFHLLHDDYVKSSARRDEEAKQMRLANDELKKQVASLTRDMEMLHHELKQKAGVGQQQLVKELAAQEFSSESFLYYAFENRFRGAPEEILKNQMRYLEEIAAAQKKSSGKYVLDVGCGRGEFLKLCRDRGVPAKGVDITKSMIDACHEQKLDAELGDTLAFLNKVQPNSLLGLTAFQVVEHVPPDYLIELVRAAFSRVAPGGVIILETVNPSSFSSLRNFYLDLTHRNPVHPETLKFLVENSGFGQARIQYSSPIPDAAKLQGADENTARLNELLFGPQDYAVIGWK